MIRKSFILVAVALLMMSSQSKGRDESVALAPLPSLFWQKQELQKNLFFKIDRTLSPIISNDKYLIDVKIETTQPTTPDFHKALGGEDEAPVKEKKNPPQIRLSEAPADSLPNDYVLFSKFGLEAPLIDDFSDFQPDGKIHLQLEKDPKEEALKKQPTTIEQMWKYNQSLDIFNNLQSVSVTVKIDSSLEESVKTVVKNLLNAIDFNLGDVKPEIIVTYVKFERSKVPENAHGIVDVLSRFSNMIGLILAALVLGFIAWILFKKYENMNKSSKDTESSHEPKGSSSDQGEDGKTSEQQGSLSTEDGSYLTGVERFKAYLDNNYKSALSLIKRWLSDNSKDIDLALSVLVMKLPNQDLSKLFSDLNHNERNMWKSRLKNDLSKDEIGKAEAFVSKSVVEEILVPFAIDDSEICDLLLKIRPEDAASIASSNKKLGIVFMNVMTPSFTSSILNYLDNMTATYIIQESVSFNSSVVSSILEELRNELKRFVRPTIKSPFLDNVKNIISNTVSEKEEALFRALVLSGDRDRFETIARDNFPSKLIPELPERFLKIVLQKYPLDEKVLFLLSLDRGNREFYMEIFAKEGTKAKDLLDLEFGNAENDFVIKKKITEEKDQLWIHFANYVRREIKRETTFKSEIDEKVFKWCQEFWEVNSNSDATQILSLAS